MKTSDKPIRVTDRDELIAYILDNVPNREGETRESRLINLQTKPYSFIELVASKIYKDTFSEGFRFNL